MYAQERAPDYHFIDIGIQGYAENTLVNFVKGPYYVKIICNDCNEKTAPVLLELAKKINKNLKGSDHVPEMFTKFPEEGKIVNSENFIASEFLGYGFMPGVYLTSYEIDGKVFKLFLIESKNEKEADGILKDLRTKAESVKKQKKGIVSLKDPYNGIILISEKDNLIYGCIDNCDTELFRKFISKQ